MKKIILGSASPRRKELLTQIGIDFEIRTSDKEECYSSNVPEDIVKELSLMKALNVADDIIAEESSQEVGSANEDEIIVIGADTVVVNDGRILGKPKDDEDAYNMIRSLSKKAHYVYTGFAIVGIINSKVRVISNDYAKTTVYVNEMTDEEIKGYISTYEHRDKAGAYGIQGRFAAFIDHIDGDYYNVVGLPVSKLYENLKKYGII